MPTRGHYLLASKQLKGNTTHADQSALSACLQTVGRLPAFEILTCEQMLMHATAHAGYENTV